MLAGKCDGAAVLDGQGFSKLDAKVGHSLAGRSTLTDGQVWLGAKLVIRYGKQLPGFIVEAAKGV